MHKENRNQKSMTRALSVLALILAASVSLSSTVARAQSTCDDPLRQTEVCSKMQFMRAQVNALDAQRDLMQVNFPYLNALGESLRDTARDIITKINMDNPQHVEALKNVSRMADALARNAATSDPATLVVANTIRGNCLTCHSNEAPPSGIRWDKIFKNDWDSVVKKCNAPGRNPYLCKSMNGMISAYGYFITANQAGVQNFAMTEKTSAEILRILGELKKSNILHMSENFRSNAENIAREINQLALKKDPEVFNRVMELPNACMQCHESRGVNPGANLNAKISQSDFWLKKAIAKK